MTVDLNALPEKLRGRRSSDYNRNWNMSLLNLLQRADMIRITSCAAGAQEETWQIDVVDERLLSRDDASVWDDVFALRSSEQKQATRDVRTFIEIMKAPDSACVLKNVFGLIQDSSAEYIEECGRCPSCRKRGLLPRVVQEDRAFEASWEAKGTLSPTLPQGITIIALDDPYLSRGFEKISHRLANAGVEQFVVARDIADGMAAAVTGTVAKFGFILDHASILGSAAAAPADVPTALIIRPHDTAMADLLDRALEWVDRGIVGQLLLVIEPHTQLRGRRVDQVMSRRAPYDLSFFDGLEYAP
jgi:ATP-dependent DNA helicase RecQ